MYQIFMKNRGANKYFLLSGLIIIFLLLLTVVYKSDEKIIKKSEINYEVSDLKTLKKFILDQIKSPFSNIDYKIKKGDTIQKILQQYQVQNNEIQTVIKQYMKEHNLSSHSFKGHADVFFNELQCYMKLHRERNNT